MILMSENQSEKEIKVSVQLLCLPSLSCASFHGNASVNAGYRVTWDLIKTVYAFVWRVSRKNAHACRSLWSIPWPTALNVVFIQPIRSQKSKFWFRGWWFKFSTKCHVSHLILKPALISRCSQAPNWQISHETHYARPVCSSCFLYRTPSSRHLHFYAVSALIISVFTHVFFVLVLSTWTHRRTRRCASHTKVLWVIWGNQMMPLDRCTELCSFKQTCHWTDSYTLHKSSCVFARFAMLLSHGPNYLCNSFLCLNLPTV